MKAYRLLLLAAIAVAARAAGADELRNPFDLPDIQGVETDEVRATAKALAEKLGNEEDPNSNAWNGPGEPDVPMKITGQWAGRWDVGGHDRWYVGKATIVHRDDRLFVRYVDESGDWLAEGVKQPCGVYAGRWVASGSSGGGGYFAAKAISPRRIDGHWLSGRWDFRR